MLARPMPSSVSDAGSGTGVTSTCVPFTRNPLRGLSGRLTHGPVALPISLVAIGPLASANPNIHAWLAVADGCCATTQYALLALRNGHSVQVNVTRPGFWNGGSVDP